MTTFDIAIIGAGIAGASLAAELGGKRSVLILEQESLPGYHSTGRSAAFWSETYGGPAIQPLTSASGVFLRNPPADFADGPLLQPRGSLLLGQASDRVAAEAMLEEFAASDVALERLDAEGIARHVQGLRPGWTEALWEPECCDIDVAALHAAYLKKARKAGAQLLCNAPLTRAIYADGHWILNAGGQVYAAKILVNAAGAWADDVAVEAGIKPIGIQPYRRTIMQLEVKPQADADMPLVVGLDGSFYFKPEAGGRLWLSPHDEIESGPCDSAPEEIDVAIAIDRLQQVIDWEVVKLERKWAGLRSFAPDRLPVIGPDPNVPEFFWLAGQGGFGIQTAPAVAQLAAGLLLGHEIQIPGIDPGTYSPARFS